MSEQPAVSAPLQNRDVPRLADTISDRVVRGLYIRMINILCGLGDDVSVDESGVDVRAERRGDFLCRLVPYRELIHVQIGEAPMVELRVRTERDFNAAVDRVLRTFLASVGSRRSVR